jgi:hypothetical protein
LTTKTRRAKQAQSQGEQQVQLENIATPQEQISPQRRYATLHRAMEGGMASPDVMRELVEICLELGHLDEARRVHLSMPDGPVRDHVTSRLQRSGLIEGSAQPSKPAVRQAEEPATEPAVADHVADAMQYLLQGHMPAIALMSMLAFPLIVGLGGFLTDGGSLWMLAGLAALPGLCVLGIVGAMGRLVFSSALEGDDVIPSIPAPVAMVRHARRHFTDLGIVLGVLIAPSLLLLWFEAPLVSSLPGLSIGLFLTPIALILRQTRGDLAALSPVLMLRAIGRTRGYLQITVAYWIAFAPAALAFWVTLPYAAWLQLSITGPLAVLPTFATARLLGTFTEVQRERLGPLLQLPLQRQDQPVKRTRSKRQVQAVAGAPGSNRVRAARARSAAARAGGNRSNKPQGSQIEGRAPRQPAARQPAAQQLQQSQQQQPQQQQPQQRQPQQQRPQQQQQQRPSQQPAQPFPGPDLSNLPGARVISGSERERVGAASRRK